MINLVFDIDDTLYDQLIPFKNAFLKVFNNYSHINYEELYKNSRKYSDEVFHLTEDGSLSLEEMHIYRISKAFLDYDEVISREQAINFQKEYALNQGLISISIDMKQIFEFAKENNINLAIITNGPENHQKKKVTALGLDKWFDEKNIFISEAINISKPNKEVFRFVQQKMNLDLDNTFYIGDSYENDVIGAKRTGWKMIWINRRNKEIPVNCDFYPDYIVKDDRELLDLLRFNVINIK